MKSARSRKSKYHGLLAEPIVAVPVSPSWNRLTTPNPTPEQLAELEEAMFAANSHNLMGIVDRVRELFEHYEITTARPEKWTQLAMALAHEHVPGFRVVRRAKPIKRPGRPVTWSEERLVRLVKAVDETRSQLNLSIKAACGFLTNNAEWGAAPASPRELRARAGTLETRYHAGKALSPQKAYRLGK